MTKHYNTASDQQEKILRALGEGSCVSKLTALHQRIGNVADVIMRLRRYGWDIHTVEDLDMNGEAYTKYSLNKTQRSAALRATQ